MARDVEIASVRTAFNAGFTRARYERFLTDLNSRLPFPADFRVSETPLFLTTEFVEELKSAAGEILHLLQTDAFRQHAGTAIPPGKAVPGEDAHPHLLQIDFGVTVSEEGSFVPRLIELQGFPSLYCFQSFYEHVFREHFTIPSELACYFHGMSRDQYVAALRTTIVGDTDPRETILLEIHPERQKTRVDFAATEQMLGVKAVCVTKVQKRGRHLFYRSTGGDIRIRRIYNRVVFDELEKTNPAMAFSFQDDLDVTWVPHPNWYYRISKHSLPFLKSTYVPPCTLVSELDRMPADLSQYVLKPLFSFAGSGVLVDVTEKDITDLNDPTAWVLQKKVQYAAFVPTEDEPSKAEIRLMFLWDREPLLATTLVRMSKGKMMGVNFNKDRTWVGSSFAYFPAAGSP